MIDYQSTLLPETATIHDAAIKIEENQAKIVLVVDDNRKLVGTITDGDVRRGLINGLTFQDNIQNIIFRSPTTVLATQAKDKSYLLKLMQKYDVRQIPIIDNEGRIAGLETDHSIKEVEKKENWVVLMAGGEGKRLRPLTEKTPKPMLSMGSKPMLEVIIEHFTKHGFYKFYISVKYKAEIIKSYFKDGSEFNVQIKYLEEEESLDTAGALGLLPTDLAKPFIIMNGDILTKTNFDHLLSFHLNHNASATMCVREYDFQIPYGVVKTNDMRFDSIQEKPNLSFYVNAGIYVLSPEVLKYIKPQNPLKMTDLFINLKETGNSCYTYLIHEYWSDIGKLEDYKQAQNTYENVFK